MHVRTASAAFEANDPNRALADQFCCAAQRSFPSNDVVGCIARQGTTP